MKNLRPLLSPRKLEGGPNPPLQQEKPSMIHDFAIPPQLAQQSGLMDAVGEAKSRLKWPFNGRKSSSVRPVRVHETDHFRFLLDRVLLWRTLSRFAILRMSCWCLVHSIGVFVVAGKYWNGSFSVFVGQPQWRCCYK